MQSQAPYATLTSGEEAMRVFQHWVKLAPAPDVSGEWVAHCLDFDVVTQGRSLPHTMVMAREAVTLVVLDDLENGHEPADRRAPKEFWTEMYQALQHSKPVELRKITDDPSFRGTMYANLELVVSQGDDEADAREPEGIALVAKVA
jgi:predicted RNase H-like HicB family nuclease